MSSFQAFKSLWEPSRYTFALGGGGGEKASTRQQRGVDLGALPQGSGRERQAEDEPEPGSGLGVSQSDRIDGVEEGECAQQLPQPGGSGVGKGRKRRLSGEMEGQVDEGEGVPMVEGEEAAVAAAMVEAGEEARVAYNVGDGEDELAGAFGERSMMGRETCGVSHRDGDAPGLVPRKGGASSERKDGFHRAAPREEGNGRKAMHQTKLRWTAPSQPFLEDVEMGATRGVSPVEGGEGGEPPESDWMASDRSRSGSRSIADPSPSPAAALSGVPMSESVDTVSPHKAAFMAKLLPGLMGKKGGCGRRAGAGAGAAVHQVDAPSPMEEDPSDVEAGVEQHSRGGQLEARSQEPGGSGATFDPDLDLEDPAAVEVVASLSPSQTEPLPPPVGENDAMRVDLDLIRAATREQVRRIREEAAARRSVGDGAEGAGEEEAGPGGGLKALRFRSSSLMVCNSPSTKYMQSPHSITPELHRVLKVPQPPLCLPPYVALLPSLRRPSPTPYAMHLHLPTTLPSSTGRRRTQRRGPGQLDHQPRGRGGRRREGARASVPQGRLCAHEGRRAVQLGVHTRQVGVYSPGGCGKCGTIGHKVSMRSQLSQLPMPSRFSPRCHHGFIPDPHQPSPLSGSARTCSSWISMRPTRRPTLSGCPGRWCSTASPSWLRNPSLA